MMKDDELIVILRTKAQGLEFSLRRLILEVLRRFEAKLREQEQSKWISVKERLPELGKEVLICDISDERKYIDVWSFEDDEEGGVVWEGKNGEWYSLDEATHWMPLPEPPEGGADHAD